jgi:hypothetical protein
LHHRQVDGFGTPENLTRVNADLTIGVGKAGSVPTVAALSFLPTAVRFAGMPSPRYWEMEDGKTDFGRLDVNTTDLARLLLAEYMLLFSNDWCVVPLELAVGTFTRIQGLLVTDVFGEQTLVRPADRGRDSDWQRWSMYRLNGDDSASMGLLLAPALMPSMRSPAVEQVRFLRDEMANMVWAVEHRIASKLGEPLDPELGASVAAAEPGAAAARFRLGETVPANWRPFVPAHLAGSVRSIRLQRVRLPNQPALPLGTVLRPLTSSRRRKSRAPGVSSPARSGAPVGPTERHSSGSGAKRRWGAARARAAWCSIVSKKCRRRNGHDVGPL